MNEQQLQKLREAITAGCSDSEACAFAEVDTVQLYEYQKENPEFVKEKQRLKEMPKAMAKVALLKKVQRASQDSEPSPESDSKAAQWLLERTDKEFAPKSRNEVTGEDGKPLQIIVNRFVE